MIGEKYEGLRISTRILLPCIILFICILVIIGWQFNIPFLIRPIPDLNAMNPVSAITFMLATVAIIPLLLQMPNPWAKNLSRIAAIVVLAIGLMRTADIAGLTTFNVDQLLFTYRLQINQLSSFETRIGLGTSLGFINLGSALIFAGINSIRLKRFANALASILILGAALFLLGYLYKAREFYFLLNILPISVQAALCFLILGRAIWAIHNDAFFIKTYHSNYLGGILVRRLVPVVMAVPITLGFVTLCLHWRQHLSTELDIIILIATIVLSQLLTVVYLGKQLNHSDKARTLAESSLKEFNKSLEQAVAERTDRLDKINRLYSMLSAVNQSIVHTKNQQDLLDNICRVATGIGHFKTAWAGLLNQHDKLIMISISGPPVATDDITKYHEIDYQSPDYENTLISKTLLTGQYVVANNVQTDPLMRHNWAHLKKNGIQATIALPIKKFGRLAGIIKFHSTQLNFFDTAEIALLEEAAGDISFALEIIEKEEQRLQAQNQLVLSEALLNRAQRIAHVGHWQLDFASGITRWSEEACRIYGLDPADNQQTFEVWKSFLHPADADETLQSIKQAQQTNSNYALKHRIVLRNGDIRYIHSETKYEFDTTGKPIGLYGVIHDITEQKKQQQAIRQSEADLSAIIENTDAFIYSLDTSFRYVRFNNRLKNVMQQLYGLQIEPGMLVYEFLNNLNPAEVKEWEQVYNLALAGQSQQFVKEYTYPTGTTYTSFSINPIFSGPMVTGLSCIARDITPQKLAELEIVALNESLEQKVKERTEQLIEVNKELETFSYTVSHDLQAPLRSINGFSKILLTDYKDKLDAEGREFLNIIDSNARRMSDLIRDLLDFARMGKAPLKIKEVDMTQLAQAAINDIKAASPGFKTEIILQPLQPAVGDASLLLQVWVNLVGNAVKYSGKHPNPLVEIGMLTIDNEPVYFVKDNGVGFDMQLAHKLFKVFQRMHSQSEFEGTGVGLTTTQRIINRHGGQIWAEGKVNEGATFYFTLP